ncbi:methyl-accepting chemotaxis protein [Desulfatirhabdium butyrativorans]|uniref:methyl-accepting chemotaxis protein n=1 Tax=Desulfatirhabdium butyrativorans TaxID=340467 RepID=UPI00042324B8|nr:methyl-accepting chemotaxis protein [Desulfatirhabdium butyrativorans]
MGRTSLKNRLILSFLGLLLAVMVVVGVVNALTRDLYLAQAISTAVAMTLGVIFGTMVSNSVLKRLNRLRDAARQIGSGDLNVEVSIQSLDELRDLEEIFSQMVQELRQSIQDVHRLFNQIQQTAEEMNGLIRKVAENNQEVGQSAAIIARGSEKQGAVAAKTAEQIDRGLLVMEEMVAQSARTVARVADAKSATEKGESHARQTLSQLQTVLSQMGSYAQPMYRVAGKVDKIRLVVNVIEEIARKTDLLSLNASIEATRAGEQGKGFALVAEEIRSMAENSKRSSAEIDRMVHDILKDNAEVIGVLQKSQEGIGKGEAIIHNVIETFGNMLAGVDKIYAEVKQIEEITDKQVRQMRRFLDQFAELANLAEENRKVALRTISAVRRQHQDMKSMVTTVNALNGLTGQMVEAKRRFRIAAEP